MATPTTSTSGDVATSYSRRLRNGVLGLVASGVVVAALLAALPGTDELRSALAGADAGWIAGAVGLEYLSCVGYVLTVMMVFYRGPARGTARLAWAELAANAAMPAGGLGGLGLGAWILRRKGIPARRIAERSAVVFLLTSAVNILALVAVGLALWVGLLSGPRDALLSLVPALIGILALIGVLAAAQLGRRGWRQETRVGRAVRSAGTAIDGSLAEARRFDWRELGNVGYFVFDVATLAAAFAAIGDVPPIASVTLAFLVGQLAGALPIPGGLGAVDGGLVGALVLYDVPLTNAAAAVLIYRVIALVLPAVLGTIAFALIRRNLDDPVELAPPRPGDLTASGPVDP